MFPFSQFQMNFNFRTDLLYHSPMRPVKFLDFIKATPRKERLAALHVICLLIFRHLAQKLLTIRPYVCAVSNQSDKKSDGASAAPSLCGVALKK